MPSGKPIAVYFLGSGALAVPVLEGLLKDGRVRIVGIGTQPDKPAGRKRQLCPTPVGQFCAERGLAVDKPASVNTPEFLDRLKGLAPETVVVASFGQLLKEAILGLPSYGCLNVHASLLPRWRGASPINAAILNGDAEAGICFMAMDRGLDTGAVYEAWPLALQGDETSESLERELATLAAGRIADCLESVCRGGRRPRPQPTEGATYAAKLRKQDGIIDWNRSAADIDRQVRGLQPWPRAGFQLETDKGPCTLQVVRAELLKCPRPTTDTAPGTILEAGNQGLVIACGQDALRLIRVIPEGRPEMAAADFLRGARLLPGTRAKSLPAPTGATTTAPA